MTEKFVIALVGAPFGLKGFVKVRPLSGETEHLLKLQSVILRQNGTENVRAIEEGALALPAVLLKFAGIDSPEAAKTLRGAELLVSREQASPLKPGEYYVEDLRGLPVLRPGPGADTEANTEQNPESGEIAGHITDIIEGGGGQLAEIRLPNGELKLVPFRKEFFSLISPEKGLLILRNQWILE